MWRGSGKWWAGLIVALLVIGVASAFWPRWSAKPQMNLILVTLDTTRADHLGCYGYDAAVTPTLDALARRGVVFERAYTPAPFTLPAHASIQTGLYPFKHGLFNNGMNRLDESLPTLAGTLTRAGYDTGAFVASYVLDRQFGLHNGFSFYDDRMAPKNQDSHGYPQRSADQVVDAALPWLTEAAAHPFFCWMHFYDPHFDYVDHSDTFGERFRDRPYDGEIAFVDRQLQRIVKFLDSRQLASNTLIIVVGDHGEGLGEHLERWHGNMLYNSTLRVPLIVSMPSNVVSDRRISTTVSIIDVAATALDCLSVAAPPGFGGRSLKPALRGKQIAPAECYAESDGVFVEEGWSPLRSLIGDDWKYIQTTKPELYDLKNDPGETTNLVEAQPELVNELDQRLSDLEAQGIRHEVQMIELSGREQKVLASLGYLGNQKSQQPNQSDHNLPDIKDSAAAIYAFQVAQELCWRKQKDAAVARLRELIEATPHYLAPRLMAGRVLENDGKLDEAKQCFAEILEIDPDNKEANARLGKLLAKKGRFHESLPYLHKALDRDVKGNRSTVAAEALPFIQKAILAEPNSIDLHYLAAKMLRTQGRNAEAVTQMRAAELCARQQEIDRRNEP